MSSSHTEMSGGDASGGGRPAPSTGAARAADDVARPEPPTGAASLADVTMPQMGVSVAEGTVVAWRIDVGDRIEADETICEISTDKIDTEIPAPVSGVLAEILVPVETTVEVGAVLARIAVTQGGGGVPAGASPAEAATAEAVSAEAAAAEASLAETASASPAAAGAASAGAASAKAASAQAATPGADAPTNGDAPESGAVGGTGRSAGGRRYSPVVQRIAAEHGIDLSQVRGTGRHGRVSKKDVLAFVNGGAGAAAREATEPPLHIESPYRPEPRPAAPGGAGQLSRMRRQIGEHMKRSLETAAHCTTWIEADMSRIEAARERLRLTALPFVARACVAALREHPALNAWLQGERYTRHDGIHLGIAVSLGEDGLIVPVVQRAHELSVEGLGAQIKELARRARARELKPDDVQGATFTITNPGQYGSIMATPIINQPQVAILDLEAVVKRPVVVIDSEGNEAIAIRPMTILGLSWDHRALDGAQAAQFLASVKRHLEGWTGA